MNKIKKSIRLKLWMPFLCLALASFTTNAVTLAQWDPVGALDSATSQINASVTATDISTTPLVSVMGFSATNTNTLPHGQIPNSATPLLTRYVEFGVSSPLEYSPSSAEYSKRSYFGTGAQSASIRSNLDGYTSDINTVVVDSTAGSQLIAFDLTSLGALTGAITFRVYFYNAVTNETDWADLESTNRGGNGVVLLGTVTPRIIPTLSQWGLILFILSLIGFTYFRTFRNN